MLALLIPFAQKILLEFSNDPVVKQFVITLLEKYAKSTGNDVDDMVVLLVKTRLLK